jgi:hypothetical protein
MDDNKEKNIESEEENTLVIELKKPYEFEGKSYDKIDLSGLENITGNDMIQVNRILEKQGQLPVLQEMKLEYAQEMASRITGYPVEFFKGLRAKDSIKLKNTISNFMFGED